jgi:GT2 family glycosyltransferase
MDVSVIIINYNTFNLTKACIQSVLEKTAGLQYEIILVDNASVETDPDIFARLFPQITLVKSPKNLGFAGGNNLGISQASGQYLLLLNSDTELQNNAIYLAWQRIKSDKNIGALSSKLLYPDGRMQYVASKFMTLEHELRELFRLNTRKSLDKQVDIYLGDRFNHTEERFVDWVWGTFFLMPRSLLSEFAKVVPGQQEAKLPDQFFMYVEDMQWCFYIHKLGYKILYYPEAVVIHHIGGSRNKAQNPDPHAGLKKILPNQYRFMRMAHGTLYAKAFFYARIALLLSLRTDKSRGEAQAYLDLIRGKLK